MGRVLSNNVSLSVGREPSLAADPTSWDLLEPNTINTYGTTISTVSRDPINRNRQRRKGTITDLDSAVEFEADLTMSSVDRFADCFIFSTAVNAEMTFSPSAVTGTAYTIPAASATQAGKLQYAVAGAQTLVHARRFGIAANNGTKVLTADTGTSDTTITVAGLSAEASPPANATLELAGVRAGDSGDLSLTVSGSSATLTSGNGVGTAIDFTTLGLTVGQKIHVGGLTTTNQFDNGAGSARITAIAAGSLTLDQLDSNLATDAGSGKNVDLLFGRFIRNVETDNAEFLEQTLQFEATFPGLGNPTGDRYQYSKGNLCNTMAFNLPLTDKATVTFAFVGTDTDNPTATRKSGAASATEPSKTTALNTSSDIARLTIPGIDTGGSTTCFKSLTLTLNNNVSPEKCLGTLGARFMNFGNFQVNLEAQLLFTDEAVITAIRNNTTLGVNFIVENDDGAVAVDLPSMTLGGGDREYPVNESVLINVTGEAFEDASLGTSIGVSLWPVYPQ